MFLLFKLHSRPVLRCIHTLSHILFTMLFNCDRKVLITHMPLAPPTTDVSCLSLLNHQHPCVAGGGGGGSEHLYQTFFKQLALI